MKNLIGKRFETLEQIENEIFEATGYYAKVIKSESETVEGLDNMLDYELYNTEDDKNNQYKEGYDGEVHTMFYLLDNANKYYITEV